MSRRVVISQPMLFPWVGLLEQLRLADVYVHYDDVQFSRGGFLNRVQIKGADGIHWMTVPLEDSHLGQRLDEVAPARRIDWRGKHLAMLRHAFARAPHRDEALALVERVYAQPHGSLADLTIASIEALGAYFELVDGTPRLRSSTLGVGGGSSERVLAVVRHLGGDVYLTGHGARRYLDHELFERHGVRVEYMSYRATPYPQLHGPFTPFVSALDLVANCGRDGRRVVDSPTVYWKELLHV